MLLLIFLITLVTYFAVHRWKNREMIKLSKQLPVGYKSIPLLGHLPHYLIKNEKDKASFLVKELGDVINSYGGQTSMWNRNKLTLLLTDPADAEFILKNYLTKGNVMSLLKLFLGDGILVSQVSKWRVRRKIFNPGFGQRLLNRYVRIFDAQANVLIDNLRAQSGKGPFTLLYYVSSLKLDTVCQTMLGVNVGAQKDKEAFIPKIIEYCSQSLVARTMQPILFLDTIFYYVYKSFKTNKKHVDDFLLQIIKSKYNEIEEKRNLHKGNGPDVIQDYDNDMSEEKSLLESILETKTEMKHEEIAEELLTLVSAGTDTSAVGSCFIAMLLAKYPDIQDKIVEEIQEVVGDRPVEATDLLRFTYLEAVIQESLRHYPPVPFVFRQVDKKATLPSGLTVLPGIDVMVHIRGLHRNPKYWDDPDEFKPERFLNQKPKHPAAFIPFSYGQRNCIGYKYAMMSMKTTLVNLVRKYRLLPADESNLDEDFPIKYAVMMKHYYDFPIKVELRS